MSNPVFANTDGTDYPLQVPGWTVQSTPAPATTYTEPQGQDVFKNDGPGPIGHTPANSYGWTVQSTGVYAS